MAVHMESFPIEEFQIRAFRGIRDLEAEGMNRVNLIVGDNNCGKTSVLEALLLLREPSDLTNLLRVARLREKNLFFGRATVFESFCGIFPQPSEEPEICLNAQCGGTLVGCSVTGRWNRILLDPEGIDLTFSTRRAKLPASMEAQAFNGKIVGNMGRVFRSKEITVHEYTNLSGISLRKDYIRMTYLSPIEHMSSYVLGSIILKEDYKDLCLRVIQIFDPDIVDLLILRNEQTNHSVEYIRHRKLGNMPVSSYGDGIKKVLLLANAIAQTVNGILLIDEIETSIHAKYYDDIFRFVLKACKQFNIQLFITTHSMETVDALLAAQDYDRFPEREDVTVLTLQKTSERTLTRTLPGREVARNRDAFDFEVRL